MTDLIMRTNHIGFTVDDLDRGIAMFSDLFGYEVVSRGGRNPRGVGMLTGVPDPDFEVVHLRREGLLGVELIAYRSPDDRARASVRPCDVGFAHLTFDVTDIDALVERAAAHQASSTGCDRRQQGHRRPAKGHPRGISARSRRHPHRTDPARRRLSAKSDRVGWPVRGERRVGKGEPILAGRGSRDIVPTGVK